MWSVLIKEEHPPDLIVLATEGLEKEKNYQTSGTIQMDKQDTLEARDSGVNKSPTHIISNCPLRYSWNYWDLIARCGVRAADLSSTLDGMRLWFPVALCETIKWEGQA